MPHHARKKDGNHDRVVAALRLYGAVVWETYKQPGLLDVIVGYNRALFWLEIKDGSLPISARRLSPDELKVIEVAQAYKLPVHVVENENDALRAIGAI